MGVDIMKEVGYIKSVADGYASVIFKEKSGWGDSCADCKSSCSSSSIVMKTKDNLGVQSGDMVEIKIKSKSFFTATFWIYVFPLIMLVFGLVGSLFIFKNLGIKHFETYSIIVGLVFLGISYYILGHIDKKLNKNQNYNIEMVRIVK